MTYPVKMIMDAENTYQVFDWLWTSGQLSPRDILDLPELGIEVVINLSLPSTANALPAEAEFVTELTLTYIQIPVEWEQPLPDQFAQFVSVLKGFAGRKMWVHCAKNMRVSAFVYLYRKLILHEDEAEALFPMREIWQPNEIWQGFIEEIKGLYAKNDPL
jgi:protein tyrosine phosphatase (PTP) superfamily phosphohydrolase (DUF442 family)